MDLGLFVAQLDLKTQLEERYSPSPVVKELQKTDAPQSDYPGPKLQPLRSVKFCHPFWGGTPIFTLSPKGGTKRGTGWEILTTRSKDVKPPTTRLMTLS